MEGVHLDCGYAFEAMEINFVQPAGCMALTTYKSRQLYTWLIDLEPKQSESIATCTWAGCLLRIVIYNILPIPPFTHFFVAPDPFAQLTLAKAIPARVQETTDCFTTVLS